MAGKKTLSCCENEIRQIVNDLGYYLVAVEYKKQISGMVLEVVIDSPNGITLNDCERVSRALDSPLDELDPTNGAPYNLNVSSMGLDRPITTEYQFNKYTGKKIVVKLYQPIKPQNIKQITAVLKAWDSDSVTLDLGDNTEIKLDKKQIAQIVPFIEF